MSADVIDFPIVAQNIILECGDLRRDGRWIWRVSVRFTDSFVVWICDTSDRLLAYYVAERHLLPIDDRRTRMTPEQLRARAHSEHGQ